MSCPIWAQGLSLPGQFETHKKPAVRPLELDRFPTDNPIHQRAARKAPCSNSTLHPARRTPSDSDAGGEEAEKQRVLAPKSTSHQKCEKLSEATVNFASGGRAGVREQIVYLCAWWRRQSSKRSSARHHFGERDSLWCYGISHDLLSFHEI